MASLAVIITLDMLRMLAGGGGAVVTAAAGTDHIGMVDPDHRCPCCIAVAVLAHVGGLNMLTMLAGCGRTVVATGAVTGHIGVIEVRRHPAVGGMAVGADIAAGNWIRGLARCRCAVVAARTAAPHL